MSAQITVLVTGANRGIGLEFVRKYLSKGASVIATARNLQEECTELRDLISENPGKLKVYQLDVTSEPSIAKLASQLGTQPIHVLINNAGYLTSEGLESITLQSMQTNMEINAYGPLFVTRALLSNLKAAVVDADKDFVKVVNMTSRMGSIADNGSGGYYAYRASKAALNAITKSLAMDLESDRIAVIAQHPGFIQTRMTGFNGDCGPEEAVEKMVKLFDRITMDDTGKFFHRDGQVLPW